MSEEKLVNLTADRLKELIMNKLMSAGLPEDQSEETANHLVYADLSGVNSHGAVRVDYYAERIHKGGINTKPNIYFEKTGPSTGIFHGDNAQGHYVANLAIKDTIEMAKESGVAVVGISKVGHTGTLSYYVEQFAKEDLIVIAMTVSDPMVVPFGGSEVYYGTNPIAFAAPKKTGRPIVFDMATTVQAWGKILDARSKNKEIPDTWAVDSDGNPTTDPHKVAGLLPIAGPKGYGLMMMVDIFSAVLLGLPFGKHVTSMYDKLSEGRFLGQTYIVIDPSRFTDLEQFKENIEMTAEELHAIKPAHGFDQVYAPGETSAKRYNKNVVDGIEIPEQIIQYLESDTIHFDKYGNKGPFAE